MEDCQDQLLTNKINALSKAQKIKDIDQYYKQCFVVLKSALKLRPSCFKYILGRKTLNNDLLLFYNTHIKPREKKLLTTWNKSLFFNEAEQLCKYVSSLQKGFTHRDFHSRNLLIHEQELILIDFQDACLGPKSYDLISLCFDPYVQTSLKHKLEMFFLGLESIKRGLRPKARDEFMESWKAVAIQRLYKILGSYNFLGNQKGKEKFFHYIKPTLDTLEFLELYDKRWPYLTKQLKEGVISLGS